MDDDPFRDGWSCDNPNGHQRHQAAPAREGHAACREETREIGARNGVDVAAALPPTDGGFSAVSLVADEAYRRRRLRS